MSRIVQPSAEGVAEAVVQLRQGRLVAMPTETVYGLAADASNNGAVAAIFTAKGRPPNHPLIVHLAAADQLPQWARNVSDSAWRLAEAFWPGPLTLILERHPNTSLAVTGGLSTVAIRVPAHPTAQALLLGFGGGLAAPSANRFGGVSPTTAAHVAESLGDTVDLILDGGACAVGLESTIVDLSGLDTAGGAPNVLRPGGISVEELEGALGHHVRNEVSERVRAPGQLASHYAPEARVRLVAARELPAEAASLATQGLVVGVLTADTQDPWPPGVVPIYLPTDPTAQAARLYAALREADKRGCHVVLTALPVEVGLGSAVADRLRKAAGPR